MRLGVILPTMAGGGMERVFVHLLHEWVKQGVTIDLVVSRFQGPLCDMIPEQVRIHEVAGRHPLLFPWGLYRYLRKHRPMHILTGANDINAMTLLIGRLTCPNASIVVSVHNHLSTELAMARGLKLFKLRAVVGLLSHFLPRAKGVVAVSKGVGNDLARRFPGISKRLHVVYNPVLTADVRERLTHQLESSPVPPGIPWIIFVGRLVPAKGLDVLLKAFHLISDTSKAHLVVLGEGPLKSQYKSMVREMGLDDRIHWAGFQDNPLPWIREASVLALPSRHEGLGNVLIEAMACGTQVVATDCPSGPTEILEGGKYGQIVPVEDPEALALAMLRSLKGTFHVDPEILKARAEEFTVEKAAREYMEVLTGNIFTFCA